MQIKPGVKLKGLVPQMVLAAMVVMGCYYKRDPLCSCTITSGNDSTHGEKSLHSLDGLCRALDFRTHDYHGDVEKLAQDIRNSLGAEYDVVVENLNGPNEHIHVEWDPKA